MAHHDDLLAHALALVHEQPQSQLTLRKAVSAAYYAVFHLLIFESTEHWDNSGLRTTLGRAYDHGLMKSTSNRILDGREFPYTNENPQVVKDLREIAQGFSQLQEDRHFADLQPDQAFESCRCTTPSESRREDFSDAVDRQDGTDRSGISHIAAGQEALKIRNR